MIPLILLTIFILLVITVIVVEIRNERKYQASRREERAKYKASKTHKEPSQSKPETETQSQPKTPQKTLPKCHYPAFKHDRLLEMGLSQSEAKEFVEAFIVQLEEQNSSLNKAINDKNRQELERITHMLKGSASNLGTGGITDLLTEFNTYLKEHNDSEIIQTYGKAFEVYTEKIKNQYA